MQGMEKTRGKRDGVRDGPMDHSKMERLWSAFNVRFHKRDRVQNPEYRRINPRAEVPVFAESMCCEVDLMITRSEFDDDREFAEWAGHTVRYYHKGPVSGSNTDTRDQDGEIDEHNKGMMEE